jgi:AcrR family transcriptional regulator
MLGVKGAAFTAGGDLEARRIDKTVLQRRSKPKQRRTARGARTLNAIQDAAVELIYQHGFENMTNQMLAAKVRIKKATLYHHISSKEDLLFDILKRATNEGIAVSMRAERASKPQEQFRLFIELSLRNGLKRKKEAFIATSELRSLAPVHRRTLLRLQHSHSDILRRIIEKGIGAGSFEVVDSQVTTAAIQQMLIGTYSWYSPGGRLTEKELISLYTALALRMVGAPTAHVVEPTEAEPVVLSGRYGDDAAMGSLRSQRGQRGAR